MLLSPNLSLDYIDVNAAQREVVHNSAARSLDALVQLAVLDRDLASPPGSPSDGQRWIVAASPTGAWAGHANHVAAWQDGTWHFYVPQVGWFAYVVDEGFLIAWNGSAWVNAMAMLTTLQNLILLGIGTAADSTNPFSAKLNNTLWVAKTVAQGGDGNLRYKLSKESAAKTLSLLMQTNVSGRAEIGLTGDDDFHVKVSPDGSAWYEAMVLSRSSGQGRLLSPLAIADGASYAVGVGGTLQLQANNASAGRVSFASVGAYATSGTAGAEVGDLVLRSMRAGTLTEAARLLGAGNLLMNIGGTAAAPAYSFNGDTDTGIYRIGANNIGIALNGTKMLDVSATGLGIGTAASYPLHIYSTATTNPIALLVYDTNAQAALIELDQYGVANGSAGAGLDFRFARGTLASPSDVVAGDRLGMSFIRGYAGGAFRAVASFEVFAGTGTISSTSLPSFIKFTTTPDGSVSRAERLRIDQSGNIVINTGAVATNATDGFPYIPTCAGPPTGTPTSYSGRVPMVYDSSNNKFYIYNGAWKGVTLL